MVEIDFDPDYMPAFGEDGNEYFMMLLHDGTVLRRSPSLGERDLPVSGQAGATAQFHDVRLPDGDDGRLLEMAFRPRPRSHPNRNRAGSSDHGVCPSRSDNLR